MVRSHPPLLLRYLAPFICLLILPSWILADEQTTFDCSRVTATGAEFDLTKLAGERIVNRTREMPPTTMVDSLRFNLCVDLVVRENIDEKDQCGKGTRACLTTENLKPGLPDRIISVVTLAESTSTYTTSADLSDDSKSLNIVFKGPEYPHPPSSTSTSQVFNVTIRCDTQPTSDPKFLSYDGSTLSLEWSAQDGCPKKHDSEPPKDDKGNSGDGSKEEESVGSGIGWFFLVILLAFVAYFGLGAYYNYSTYGARGIDLIPHRDFWQEVPYMLKDVISHLCSSVHPRRSSRGGYVAV
ncbi:Autophagy-related protein 27 [Leucoagaricus sp. SymC.cos]|nr:Autophagy-related protein 27 [Leucoagaricus sp. SymC.cos]